jgi:molecular chaperone GrpE (heat shock protein)
MSDPLAIDDAPIPLPAGVMDADAAHDLAQALLRIADLERASLAGQRQAQESLKAALLALLDVADAIDRMADYAERNRETSTGVARLATSLQSTKRMLARSLAKLNVQRLQVKGQPLDPACASVESEEERDDLPEETVTEELIAGYRWGERILRKAKVVISRLAAQ